MAVYPKLKTMADIKSFYYSKHPEGHWFDRKTISFFNSKLPSNTLRGRFFVTGERYDMDCPLRFSARFIDSNGDINTLGEFQQFFSKTVASSYIQSLPKYFVEAYEKARDCFFEKRGNVPTDFLTHLIDDESEETFCGACQWVLNHWKEIDAPCLGKLKDELDILQQED